MSTSLTKFTLWAAPALQTARETPRIALAPSFAANTRKHMSKLLQSSHFGTNLLSLIASMLPKTKQQKYFTIL